MAPKKIRELQRLIDNSKQELTNILKQEQPMPELISTTNVLRTNEYLNKKTKTQTQLLTLYEQYAKELEKLVSNISKIKANINVLRRRKVRKTKRRKKTRQKTKRKRPKRKARKIKKRYRKTTRRQKKRRR